jgi:hypothetical protein
MAQIFISMVERRARRQRRKNSFFANFAVFAENHFLRLSAQAADLPLPALSK